MVFPGISVVMKDHESNKVKIWDDMAEKLLSVALTNLAFAAKDIFAVTINCSMWLPEFTGLWWPALARNYSEVPRHSKDFNLLVSMYC